MSKSGFRFIDRFDEILKRWMGPILVASSLAILIADVIVSVQIKSSGSSMGLYVALMVGVILPVPMSIGGILVKAPRIGGLPRLSYFAGVVAFVNSIAWLSLSLTQTPFPIPFNLLGDYHTEPTDRVVLNSNSTPETNIDVPSDIQTEVVNSLANAHRIWMDGSEVTFEGRLIQNNETVIHFSAMGSGNLIVDERLYVGPSSFRDFVQSEYVKTLDHDDE